MYFLGIEILACLLVACGLPKDREHFASPDDGEENEPLCGGVVQLLLHGGGLAGCKQAILIAWPGLDVPVELENDHDLATRGGTHELISLIAGSLELLLHRSGAAGREESVIEASFL